MNVKTVRNLLFALGIVFSAFILVLSNQRSLSVLSHDGVVDSENFGTIAVSKTIFLAFGVLFFLLAATLHLFREKFQSGVNSFNDRFIVWFDSMPDKSAARALFWVSFLGLFFEILVIRWITVEIRLFAYMKNFSLMSCFLGLGIGYALSRRKTVYFPFFLPVFSIFCSFLFLCSHAGLTRFVPFPDVNQMIWGVNWWRVNEIFSFAGFYAVLIGLFAANLLCFVPLGQLSGRLMLRFKPIRAYMINIAGSLFGMLAFTFLSWLSLSPPWWFLFGCIPIFILLLSQRPYLYISASFSACFLVLILMLGRGSYWSPYYKIDINDLVCKDSAGSDVVVGKNLQVNQDYHQRAINLSDEFVEKIGASAPCLKEARLAYDLPYRFTKPKKVLVVGAGMGNDVAAALRHGAKSVRAVEIDPTIVMLGKKFHPEKPYSDPRVTLTINDARTFFELSDEKFDLIVYGLLDSHSQFSNFSNLRLDNFIYTRESFELARGLLGPGGLITLSYATAGHDSFVFQKLFVMLERLFNAAPLTIYTTYDGGYLFVCGDDFDRAAHEKSLAKDGLTVVAAPDRKNIMIPTDNWPFLYLKENKMSGVYRGALILVFILSVLMIKTGFQGFNRFDLHYFFLGAAFLLIEFRSITEMALLLGSTWIVNSVVISAVLAMILMANIIANKMKRVNFGLLYVLLIASILAGYFIPLHMLAIGGTASRALLGSLVLILPIMIAGIIFAGSIKNITDLDDAFGSNLIGAVFGGLCEYVSMVYGLKSVYFIAIIFYILSYAFMKLRRI